MESRGKHPRETNDSSFLVAHAFSFSFNSLPHFTREEISNFPRAENSAFKVREWADERARRLAALSGRKQSPKLVFISFPASRLSFLSFDYSGRRSSH